MHSSLLWGALAFYGLGILLTLPSVIRRRPTLSSSALAALAAGLSLQAAELVTAAIQLRRLPVVDVPSAVSFLAFCVTLAFFFAYLRYRITSLGLFMLPFVFLLTLIAATPHARSLDSAGFHSGWLIAHISTTILGYTGLFLTFVAAVMYLIQERELKSKTPRAFYYRLPSLEICDSLYYRSLIFGLAFLTAGILTGLVMSSREWRGPWEFDPKIVASLAVWVIYLVLFSTRLSGNWRGRRSAYGAVLGFALIMATLLGVTFLSGQHGLLPKLGGTP